MTHGMSQNFQVQNARFAYCQRFIGTGILRFYADDDPGKHGASSDSKNGRILGSAGAPA
jgi:hypothetical protein